MILYILYYGRLPSPRHPLCTTNLMSHVSPMVDLALWGAALKKINNKTARFARACEEAQWIGWGAMELLYEPSGTIASITVWRWRLSAMISNSGTVPHLWIWIISWYLQGSWNNLWHLRETMSFRSISRGLDGALERAAGLASSVGHLCHWHTSFVRLCQDES